MPPRSGSGPGAAALEPLRKHAPSEKDNYVPSTLRYYYIPRVGEKYTGLLGDHHKERPFLQRVDWISFVALTLTPILGVYGVFTTPFDWRTYAFALFWYFFTGIGITAGYHRLFAHRAYKATSLGRALLCLAGSGAVEGSVLWWSRGHRAHHKYVDTDKDPYAVVKGFWHAHIGWMLVKRDKDRMGRADDADLVADPVVMWQHRNYLPIALFMAFVVPTLVCGLGWGDYYGGYFIAGVARLVFVHHSTFCVNSLAHWAGDATYTDGHTARNSIITALVTLGEGYHNFHHEFPSDYRNGVEWWQYDPTKIVIYALFLVGLAYDLQTFPQNEIVKGQLQMQHKLLERQKQKLFWGPQPENLPLISEKEFVARAAAGERLMCVDGFALDVAEFMGRHPGGASLLSDRCGKDATSDFKGVYYKHSNAARNLVETLRVARIEGYWSKN